MRQLGMVKNNVEHIEDSLTKEELEKRVNWYSKKYGPYIEKRGAHNWKNLFRKPTMYEWVILFMIILSLFMFWAYSHDVESSFQNGYSICLYDQGLYSSTNDNQASLNFTLQRGQSDEG